MRITALNVSRIVKFFVVYVLFLAVWKCPLNAASPLQDNAPCLCPLLHRSFTNVIQPIYTKHLSSKIDPSYNWSKDKVTTYGTPVYHKTQSLYVRHVAPLVSKFIFAPFHTHIRPKLIQYTDTLNPYISYINDFFRETKDLLNSFYQQVSIIITPIYHTTADKFRNYVMPIIHKIATWLFLHLKYLFVSVIWPTTLEIYQTIIYSLIKNNDTVLDNNTGIVQSSISVTESFDVNHPTKKDTTSNSLLSTSLTSLESAIGTIATIPTTPTAGPLNTYNHSDIKLVTTLDSSNTTGVESPSKKEKVSTIIDLETDKSLKFSTVSISKDTIVIQSSASETDNASSYTESFELHATSFTTHDNSISQSTTTETEPSSIFTFHASPSTIDHSVDLEEHKLLTLNDEIYISDTIILNDLSESVSSDNIPSMTETEPSSTFIFYSSPSTIDHNVYLEEQKLLTLNDEIYISDAILLNDLSKSTFSAHGISSATETESSSTLSSYSSISTIVHKDDLEEQKLLTLNDEIYISDTTIPSDFSESVSSSHGISSPTETETSSTFTFYASPSAIDNVELKEQKFLTLNDEIFISDTIIPNYLSESISSSCILSATEIEPSSTISSYSSLSTNGGLEQQKLLTLDDQIHTSDTTTLNDFSESSSIPSHNIETLSPAVSTTPYDDNNISGEILQWKKDIEEICTDAIMDFENDILQVKTDLTNNFQVNFEKLLTSFQTDLTSWLHNINSILNKVKASEDGLSDPYRIEEETFYNNDLDGILIEVETKRELISKEIGILVSEIVKSVDKIRKRTLNVLEEYGELSLQEYGGRLLQSSRIKGFSDSKEDSKIGWKEWKKFYEIKDRLFKARDDIILYEVEMNDIAIFLNEIETRFDSVSREVASYLSLLRAKAELKFQQRDEDEKNVEKEKLKFLEDKVEMEKKVKEILDLTKKKELFSENIFHHKHTKLQDEHLDTNTEVQSATTVFSTVVKVITLDATVETSHSKGGGWT